MPAAIKISPNEKNWIRNYLQKIYDLEINDAYDCQNLSFQIEKNKGIKISYSTFRRLFNLVPNTSSFSRFVLNSLAVAVGFKNWEAFKTHVSHFDINVINQNIQIYALRSDNSRPLILETVKKLPLSTWSGGYQLQNIISIAIDLNDFELLEKIVHLDFEIDNHIIYEHLVIGFQVFYFAAVKKNEAVIEFVRTNVANSVVLQKCLLQAYVDEKYLDCFIGKWFDEIHFNTLPDLLLFKNLLMCQKFYNKKNKAQAKVYFQLALNELENSKGITHPILKARIGVWELILNNNDKKLNSFFENLQTPFDKADFAVISSRLIWMFYNEDYKIQYLDEISLDEFPPVKDFFQKGRYNMLHITLAIHCYIKNEKIKVKQLMNLYSPTTLGFDIVNIKFYDSWLKKIEF